MSVIFSIFPKFFRHLSHEELAAMIRETGLDTTNLVVRDEYWCEPKTLARDVPRFVQAMSREGLKIHFATATYQPDEAVEDPTPLKILAENGVREYRMAYFNMPKDYRIHEALKAARGHMEKLADVCLKVGIRVVYQIHHTMLIASPSAAYDLVKGLPPEAVGIEFDPGNQSWEGFEDWERSVVLLGDYLVAYGVKDTKLTHNPAEQAQPSKGWTRDWCGVHEGVVNWHEVVRPLIKRNWSGTFVFMPFYHEDDVNLQAKVLKQEVAYLRNVFREETEKASSELF